MTETLQHAYERGVEAGKVATRLDHHAAQIAATNVLLARTVEISQTMASTVQTLTEARVTDAATRVTTAEAVEAAKTASESQASVAWSPLAKFLVALGSLIGVAGMVWGFLSSLPHLTGG